MLELTVLWEDPLDEASESKFTIVWEMQARWLEGKLLPG